MQKHLPPLHYTQTNWIKTLLLLLSILFYFLLKGNQNLFGVWNRFHLGGLAIKRKRVLTIKFVAYTIFIERARKKRLHTYNEYNGAVIFTHTMIETESRLVWCTMIRTTSPTWIIGICVRHGG